MHLFVLILLVFAFVSFVLAAIGVTSGRYNLIGAGLAAAVLAHLLTAMP